MWTMSVWWQMAAVVGRMFHMPVEDIEPLHQHLLCIAEHEAGGEAGLELGCSEGDQVADMESKKEWQSVRGFGEESMGYLLLDLSSQLGKAGGVHDEGAT